MSAAYFYIFLLKGYAAIYVKKNSAFSELFHSKGQVPLKNVGFTLSDVP